VVAVGQVPEALDPGPGGVLTPEAGGVPEPGTNPGGDSGTPDPGTDPGGDPGQPADPVESPAPSDPPAGIVMPGGGVGGNDSGTRGNPPGGSGSTGMSNTSLAGPFGNDPLGQLVLLAAAVSTGTTLGLAFLLFGRRRRDDEYDEEVLAAAAAAPYGIPVPVAVPAFDPGTGGTDVDLPRWRRPSLMAARKSDPVRNFDAPAHLTFERSGAGVDGERRLVRYRLVRLMDRPDELAGLTVHTLDAGDEVAVVETSGLYRRVVTPDGRTGWLHKMTLGDVIETAPPEGDEGLDPDVLMAYLAARARG